MSGHSHARTVKSKKEAGAKQRSQIFSKMNRLITIAVRSGGPNPDTNSKLRMAIESARGFNMPNDNIERAIKKASGEGEGGKLEEFIFEAYGPGNVAMLIEGITDNKNRSLANVKKILNGYNGKMVQGGAIQWMFERKGYVGLELEAQSDQWKDKEKLELAAIEAEAEDVAWNSGTLDIYTGADSVEKVKKNLEEKGIAIASAGMEWKPKEEMEVDEKTKEGCQKLFDALDEDDDVQNVYSNLKY